MTRSPRRRRLLTASIALVACGAALELGAWAAFFVLDGRCFSFARLARERVEECGAGGPRRSPDTLLVGLFGGSAAFGFAEEGAATLARALEQSGKFAGRKVPSTVSTRSSEAGRSRGSAPPSRPIRSAGPSASASSPTRRPAPSSEGSTSRAASASPGPARWERGPRAGRWRRTSSGACGIAASPATSSST